MKIQKVITSLTLDTKIKIKVLMLNDYLSQLNRLKRNKQKMPYTQYRKNYVLLVNRIQIVKKQLKELNEINKKRR